MPVSLVRFSSMSGAEGSDGILRYRAVAWGVVLLSAVVFGGIFGAVAAGASDWLRSWIPVHTGFAIVAGGLGTALTEMAGAEAQLSLDFRRYFQAVGVGALMRLLGVVGGVVVAGPTVSAALWGYGLSSLVGGVLLARQPLLQNLAILSRNRRDIKPILVEVARFTLPVVGSTFAVGAIGSIDTLAIAPVLSSADVGVYAAGVRLTALQSTMLAGVTVLALPLATRATREGAQDRFAKRVFVLGGSLGLAVTLCLVLLSSVLVRAVYGSHFLSSAPIFAVLSVGLLLNFVGNPLSQLIYAASAPRILLVAHLCQLTALAVGLPAVASHWHVIGVATYRAAVNAIVVAGVIIAAVKVGHLRHLVVGRGNDDS